MSAQTHDKVFWHEAFYEALRLEFHEYLDSLTFLEEHPLSKEALIVDVIIIKKVRDVQIKKNIGQIFRGHNLFEFKSEDDSLTIRDYNKVIGYAYLYASFVPVDVSDLTVSFAVTVHPRALLAYLRNDRQFNVSDNGSGIYNIAGEVFPVQILESKKLLKENNLFLKNLRSSLDVEDAKETAEAYKGLKTYDSKNVYMDRLIRANHDSFKEATIMGEAARELFLEVAEEQGWLEDKIKKIAQGLKKNNVSTQIIVESTGLTAQEVEAL